MFHQTHVIKSAAIELPDALRPADSLPAVLLDFRRFRDAVRNNKRLIAAAVLLSLSAAIAFMLVATPKYTAVTQILIDPSDLKAVENGLTSNTQLSDVAVLQAESQVRVLTSDNVLRRVITSERLDTDSKFIKGATTPLRSLLEALIKPFGIFQAAGKLDPTLAALYELQRCIRVKRAERTYVVDVSVTTDDSEKSVRIANALTQAYLAEQAAARYEAARRVSASLSARLNELKNRVRMAEERVEEFKSRNNIVGASGQLVNEQQLSELNNQLSLARGRTAEAKSRFEQLQSLQRSNADVGSFTEAVQSQTMAALRSQYAEVLRREAELTTSLGERHPTVIEIRAQGQRLRRVIGEEINRIAQAARNDYERARVSEESLARGLETLKSNTLTTNEARVELRELERDVQAGRAVYESFLVRSRETGEQERLDTKNFRVISKADVPLRRSWPPSYALIAFGCVILGLSAGTGLALVRDLNKDRNTSPHIPREAPSDLPLLAVLPNIGVGHPLSSFEDPKSRPAAEIRKLHDLLRAGRKKWTGQSILLVAPHDGGEASAVALNLAMIAAANNTVLLIDADIRRQALAAVLPHHSHAGLIDIASGQKLLSEVVIRDPRTNIHILPLFAQRIGSYRNVKNEDIRTAFDQTKKFDLVIVLGTLHDGNPVAAFFAGLVDQVVLIIREGAMRQRDIDGAVSVLVSEARKIRGTVLTNVKA